jgi:hypothetical protein
MNIELQQNKMKDAKFVAFCILKWFIDRSNTNWKKKFENLIFIVTIVHWNWEFGIEVFMFALCISSIKTLFIVPTDAHYYKYHRMLKSSVKLMTVSRTCFGSRRNHHQGAILCLAKTTKYVFFCSRPVSTQSYLWRHISCNKRVSFEYLS